MHELFKKRRSHRQFSEEEVTELQVKEILNAAMVSPSANHINPWEFIVVRDQDVISKFDKLGQWQTFAAKAPVSIVVCARESDSKNWLEDCSIAAAHIYLEATNQGLATCWANIRNGTTVDGGDREQYVRDLLQIPEDYRVVCIMPIGHPVRDIPEYSEEDYKEGKVHEEGW
jgi:nitroreductase